MVLCKPAHFWLACGDATGCVWGGGWALLAWKLWQQEATAEVPCNNPPCCIAHAEALKLGHSRIGAVGCLPYQIVALECLLSTTKHIVVLCAIVVLFGRPYMQGSVEGTDMAWHLKMVSCRCQDSRAH